MSRRWDDATVADIARQARQQGRPISVAVARHYQTTKKQAADAIYRARRNGHHIPTKGNP